MTNEYVAETMRHLVSAPVYEPFSKCRVSTAKSSRRKLCIIQRLLNRTQGILKDNECWLVNSHLNKNGYVIIQYNYKNYLGHRIMWSKYYNYDLSLIPKHLECSHTCHNSNCINPTHIVLETHAENLAHVKNTTLRGRGKGAKIDEQTAKTIIQRRNAGEKLRTLSCEFGVTESYVSLISRGKCRGYLSDT